MTIIVAYDGGKLEIDNAETYELRKNKTEYEVLAILKNGYWAFFNWSKIIYVMVCND